MLPVAVAVAMVGFIGAFGNSTPAAYAIEGDICAAHVDAPHSDTDAFGNDLYIVGQGDRHGLVFRVEDSVGENVEIRIDSETGSARITSQAEFLNPNDLDDENDDEPSYGNFYDPDIGHILTGGNGVGTQVVDTFEPFDFNDADGNPLDGINDWLVDVGYSAFASDDWTECDSGDFVDNIDDLPADCDVDEDEVVDPDDCDEIDGWGFIDFECIEPGFFHIDILTPDDTSEVGLTIKFLCPNVPDTATISARPTTLETDPVGSSSDTSNITVTVEDTNGDRVEHALVSFTTDNCEFEADDSDDYFSPAGGGVAVETTTDTDTSSDNNFIANNPAQFSAGTAEVDLDCSDGDLGSANVTAVVERPGSNIVLHTTITVVGSTAGTGLTLELTPEDFECGETLLATATAVDADGQPVSDGTLIYFTTDTSSGIVGGSEGAQGGVATDDGVSSVLIATDPSNPGIHTVIAYATKGNVEGQVIAQASATYTCEGAVAPAPPVEAPDTGTGTGSITPPNTGDAGLASGSTSASLFIVAGVAFVLAGLASIRFARN